MRLLPVVLLALTLLPCPLFADELSFEPQQLKTELGVGYAVRLIDMNEDDKLDICIVDQDRIVWLENPNWNEHEILGPGQTNQDNVAFAPADIDGDGKLDFAVAAGWGGGKTQRGTIQWITSNGSQANGSSAKHWAVHPIRNEHSTHRIKFANVVGDDKPELIVGPLFGPNTTGPHFAEHGVRLVALEIPENPTTEPWPLHMIDNSLHVMHNFLPIDFTGNGQTDIITASYEGVFLLERQADGSWTKSQLGSGDQESSPSRGASEVKVGRLANGDRYIATIEPWHGNQVVVYTKPQDQPLRSLWKRQVLDDQLKWGHAVWCVNLDADADEELVIGVRDDQTDSTRRGVRIFDPQDANGSQFKRYVVDPGAVAVEDLAVADLNANGQPDIVAVGRQTHNVKIYWNKTQ
ncbi:FG-GAP repeat domain-containing protein [Bremerella sp. T1]|uniref:FG-GAP repeat domain-containing protein n=1 Tax=Bremerella sp. TYQ1 TaxID=3119568 RepID=UPI001CCDF064|nr:VCBS repeat-containing protein [Bremerella volcania]UBM34107.1 VCBS repeat-containing protein [Bremerella volcania]